MEAAKNSLTRIFTSLGQIEHLLTSGSSKEDAVTGEEQQVIETAEQLRDKFQAALDDDFNTADAIAAIFELVKLANTSCTSDSTKMFLQSMHDRITQLCNILGIITKKEAELLDEEIEKLIEERQNARKTKNFARSDEIRNLLLEKGIVLEDTREGVRWKRS
jgi:cysteinyl-tRNA synthetase